MSLDTAGYAEEASPIRRSVIEHSLALKWLAAEGNRILDTVARGYASDAKKRGAAVSEALAGPVATAPARRGTQAARSIGRALLGQRSFALRAVEEAGDPAQDLPPVDNSGNLCYLDVDVGSGWHGEPQHFGN